MQSGELQVDHAATLTALDRWADGYEKTLTREVERLASAGDPTELIFSDVAPMAFDVAARLQVPCVAMANFSWDWIYRELGYVAHADEAARAYAYAEVLLELEPGCPMPAFPRRSPLGVIGRRASVDRQTLRGRLGVQSHERLIMPAFRTLDPAVISLPAPEPSIRYVIPGDPVERPDVILAGESASFVELLAAADLVVAKPGYGIIGDSAAAGTPILYPSRRGFPEDSHLEQWLSSRAASAPIDAQSLSAGSWLVAAKQLLRRERPLPSSNDGLVAGSEELLRRLG